MPQSRLALISFIDGGPGIDNSLPGLPPQIGGGPVYPPVYPGHALPGGGHISLLPVFPFDPTVPDNTLPTPPPGGTVDNTLPTPPAHISGQPIVPGRKFVVKWLACTGLILVPDNTLPPTAEPK